MRPLKIKHFVFLMVLSVVYLILYMFFDTNGDPDQVSFVNLEHVVVHLDFKGAPPRLQYLERLLPLFIQQGVTGLLMEYEDMFPYEGKLLNLSSRDSYNRDELRNFLTKVKESRIEVIPLIQTFGHMEHVLKLEEFAHLREVKVYPDSICPSNLESIELIKNMLEQVIHFHMDIAPLKHMHIGCDEVFQMNKCHKCRVRDVTKTGIFIRHVHKLSEIISNISPHTTILIWDDILRGFNKYQWREEHIEELKNIEPVYWDYTPTPIVSHADLFQYHKTFRNIWIATAFKGASGRQATLPDFKARFMNHHGWMNLILNYVFGGEKEKFNFKGIILTGWSRYSHMDPLCELLPLSIPSLIVNLRLIKKYRSGITINDNKLNSHDFYKKYIVSDFCNDLNCNNVIIEIEDVDIMLSDSYKFESSTLFSLIKQFKSLMEDVETAFSDEDIGLSSIHYYGNIKNLNMNNVNKTKAICKTYIKDLELWEQRFSKEMLKFYENYVIREYVDYKMYSTKKKVKDIVNILESYMETHYWDRRAYNILNTVN